MPTMPKTMENPRTFKTSLKPPSPPPHKGPSPASCPASPLSLAYYALFRDTPKMIEVMIEVHQLLRIVVYVRLPLKKYQYIILTLSKLS
jgi:hypothetical protein